MNYAHEFHAGGFADVHKHSVLCRVLAHLRNKDAAFRVIDTHAGSGLYDLAGTAAERSAEWRGGIARLIDAPLPGAAAALLAPYLDAVRALNKPGKLVAYPGSPLIARSMMRPQDRLLACELHPDAAAALSRNLHGDAWAKALRIDGWTALAAYVPPKERRGLVLIDPPFEENADFARLSAALSATRRKWATGIYLIWYPIKTRAEPDRLARRLRRLSLPKILRCELTVNQAGDRLSGSGLIVINPPWRLGQELSVLLPALASCLGRDGQGRFRLDWLAGEVLAASR